MLIMYPILHYIPIKRCCQVFGNTKRLISKTRFSVIKYIVPKDKDLTGKLKRV